MRSTLLIFLVYLRLIGADAIEVESCSIIQLMYDRHEPQYLFYGLQIVLDPHGSAEEGFAGIAGMSAQAIVQERLVEQKPGARLHTSLWNNYTIVSQLPTGCARLQMAGEVSSSLYITGDVYMNRGQGRQVRSIDEITLYPNGQRPINITKTSEQDFYLSGIPQLIIDHNGLVKRAEPQVGHEPYGAYASIAFGVELAGGERLTGGRGIVIYDLLHATETRIDAEKPEWCRAFPDSERIAVKVNNEVRVYDALGKFIFSKPCRPRWIRSSLNNKFASFDHLEMAEIDSDGKRFAICSDENRISIFSTETGQDLGAVNHDKPITAFCFLDSTMKVADATNVLAIMPIVLGEKANP
jgi:hypothetical protein